MSGQVIRHSAGPCMLTGGSVATKGLGIQPSPAPVCVGQLVKEGKQDVNIERTWTRASQLLLDVWS